ncbi:MAG: hypothetical protein AB7G48_10320 [Nitrospiraceae bacterium]
MNGDGLGLGIPIYGEFVNSLDRALRDRCTLYVPNILAGPADQSVGMKRLAG